jgi:murein DD-endopeptidase MepM/ murein hydrolase activator NlpD
MNPLLFLPLLLLFFGKKASGASRSASVRAGAVPSFHTPFDISVGNAFRSGQPFTSYAAIDAALGKSNFGQVRPNFVQVEGGGKKYPSPAEAKTGGTRKHAGRDIFFPPGTPIFAPEAGTITAKGAIGLHTSDMSGKTFQTASGPVHRSDEDLYGWAISLQVSGGNDYRFLHLEKSSVTAKGKGDKVAAGEFLGRVVAAPTMASARAHLHLEAHRNTYSAGGKSTGRTLVDPVGDSVVNLSRFNTLCGR